MDGFKAVMEARDFVLTAGVSMDKEALDELLVQHDLLTEEMSMLLNNKLISKIEKYAVLRDKVGNRRNAKITGIFVATGGCQAPNRGGTGLRLRAMST